METEEFESEREFRNKYPSGLYICSFCEKLTPFRYFCINCKSRADGLFKTFGKGYQYIIKEFGSEIYEIFTPIERRKNE